jgi:FKBP-type peptidyl-prolyl cis-trans isomerase 2
MTQFHLSTAFEVMHRRVKGERVVVDLNALLALSSLDHRLRCSVIDTTWAEFNRLSVRCTSA